MGVDCHKHQVHVNMCTMSGTNAIMRQSLLSCLSAMSVQCRCRVSLVLMSAQCAGRDGAEQ